MSRSRSTMFCLTIAALAVLSPSGFADEPTSSAETNPELAELYSALPDAPGRFQLEQAFGIESQPGAIRLTSATQQSEYAPATPQQYYAPQAYTSQGYPSQGTPQQMAYQQPVGHNHEVGEYIEESSAEYCEPRRTFIGGAAAVFLRPYFENNIAFTVIDPTVAAAGNVERNREFDYDYDTSQRYWLGLMSDTGFAGRVRWWFFDQNSDRETFVSPAAAISMLTPDLPGALPATPSGGNIGDSVSAKAELEMYTIDAELFQRVHRGRWEFDLGGGLRHAAIKQGYEGASSTAGVVTASQVGHRFDGIGPTAFMELRRPIGDSTFALIANTRGSLLYGDSKLSASRFTVGGAQFGSIETRKKEVRGIAEVQIGGEWGLWMIGGSRIYLQGLLEGQQWFGAGNAVSDSGDMGLAGFSASARLEW